MDHTPIQETTSIYFNGLLRKDVRPLSVDALPPGVVDDFNKLLRVAFTDEADEVIARLRYLIPYILQSIDWDRMTEPLEAWQLRYYYQRERFLERTGLSYDIFLDHKPLQRAICSLGLDPSPTFEFILFLRYYFSLRSELRFSPMEQLRHAVEALERLTPDRTASMDINVGGKHFKFNNASFVKAALSAIPLESLRAGAFHNDFNEGGARDKVRALDYYMVKTLLDYLPLRTARPKKGTYSQEERDFSLSVLSFVGRLPDIDREGECSKENNVTFDKLMRDFKGVPIPFAMELFL